MNTTRKGRAISTKAAQLGRELGYEVYVCPHTRYQKDAFGIADQIWIKTAIMIFVQVRNNQWGDLRKQKNFSRQYQQWVKELKWMYRKGSVESGVIGGEEICER